MERRDGIWDRLAAQADLAAEAIPGQPLVELFADRRVLIENHKGVTQYGHDRIVVRTGVGTVEILGCSLEISFMSREQLVINGCIDGIILRRR